MAKEKLQLRKQELVRDTIYDAAIDLFAAKGFDETTVEEIAQAAGVSRRSFFRYYASKDDLLAQSVVQYGSAITKAVETCPASLSACRTDCQEASFCSNLDPVSPGLSSLCPPSALPSKQYADPNSASNLVD